MSSTVQSVYQSVDKALKLDDENRVEAAYVQYLKSIVVTASHLLQESRQAESISQLSTKQIRKLMKVIAMSIDRIESILGRQDQNGNHQNLVPPQYEEVMNRSEIDLSAHQPNQSAVNDHTPNLSPIQRISSNFGPNNQNFSISYLESFDVSDPRCAGEESFLIGHSRSSDDSDSSSIKKLSLSDIKEKMPLFCNLRQGDEPSPMEAAVKKNKSLMQTYKKRLQNLTKASSRVQVTLELQRRLVDNLRSAEAMQRKHQELLKMRHDETILKIQGVLESIDQGKEGNFSPDPRLQYVCSQCIEYEERILDQWPDRLRLSLIPNAREDLVVYVVNETLNVPDHPLTVWLHKKRQEISESLHKVTLPHEEMLRKMTHPDFCIRPSLFNCEDADTTFKSEMNITMVKIVKEIKDVIEVAANVLLLMYLDIGELENGKTVCVYMIQDFVLAFFWNPLIRFFKLTNYFEYMKFKQIIFNHRTCQLKNLKEEMDLDSRMDHVCLEGAERFREILHMSSPIHKVEKLCSVFNFISIQFAESRHKHLAADDLIPLITYTFLLCSNADMLISEIKAIQCFLDDRDLFGEKAYCVATMETVLLSLSTIDITQPHHLPQPSTSSPS